MRWRGMWIPAALFWVMGCGDSPVDPEPLPVHWLVVTPAEVEVAVGGTAQLGARALDSRGHEVKGVLITWVSAAPEVATVSPSGLVQGVSPGRTQVTAACEHVSREVPIVVPAPDWTGRSWAVDLGVGTFARVNDVWGSSATDVFAVGSSTWDCCAAVHHYDGASWRTIPVPAWDELQGVWGSSADDIFAVGGRRIVHFDGTAWTSMRETDQTLKAVWGTSSHDVFAAGAGPILHYDGDDWGVMAVPSGSLGDAPLIESLWGSSGTDVFGVGRPGVILHYDGTGWSRMASPAAGDLVDVWGSAADDVFAVGERGSIVHYDGSAWSAMVTPDNPLKLYGVWGASSSDVFAVGGQDLYSCCAILLHFDGVAWTERFGPQGGDPIVEAGPGRYWYGESLRDVWGVGGHVFLVGTGPTILHSRP